MDKTKIVDDFVGLEQLVLVGRQEGVLLTRVHLLYYKKSNQSPAAQSIIVYYSWTSSTFETAEDNLQIATTEILNQLDYRSLKESMK